MVGASKETHPHKPEKAQSMFATLHAPAHTALRDFPPKAVVARILAALVAAEARAKTRRDYELVMGSDEILSDIGVCREDMRRAMETGRF
jgi:uncharacterized protein YjiS (DUF1127 family)